MKKLRALDSAPEMERWGVLATKHSRLIDVKETVKFTEGFDETLSAQCPRLKLAGTALADLTACQAMFRELDAGETRKTLVAKVDAGLKRRKWHTTTTSVQALVDSTAGIRASPDTRVEDS